LIKAPTGVYVDIICGDIWLGDYALRSAPWRAMARRCVDRAMLICMVSAFATGLASFMVIFAKNAKAAAWDNSLEWQFWASSRLMAIN